MALDFLFGKRKTPEEMLKQNQRALNRATRDLDRERAKLEAQEKKIIADIKKMAKQGQMDAVKIMAKDLVRTRKYVKKFMLMRTNIQAVSLRIQTLRSSNQMAQAMKGVAKRRKPKTSGSGLAKNWVAQRRTLEAKERSTMTTNLHGPAMGTMNKQLKLPQIQKIMMDFEKQSEIMDMKEEMMNDALDDALGDEDDEEESDAIVTQVLDELGLQLGDELTGLPQTGGALASTSKAKEPVAADADADLQARLENLRRE